MRLFCLCCIHATFALFYCLLFNLNLNSYEFEFKLNVFESFQKWKSLPFSPLLFSPAGPSLLFLFSFLFFPAAQKTISPACLPSSFPAQPVSASSPAAHRQEGPACGVVSELGTSSNSCRVRAPHVPSRCGPHAKATPPGPINSAVAPQEPQTRSHRRRL